MWWIVYPKYRQTINQLKSKNQHIFNEKVYKKALLDCLIAYEIEIKWKGNTISLVWSTIDDFTVEWLEKIIEVVDVIYEEHQKTLNNIQNLIKKYT